MSAWRIVGVYAVGALGILGLWGWTRPVEDRIFAAPRKAALITLSSDPPPLGPLGTHYVFLNRVDGGEEVRVYPTDGGGWRCEEVQP